MTTALDLHPDAGHPAVAAVLELHALLDLIDPRTPLTGDEHATCVSEVTRAISRLEGVRLRLVAAAEKDEVAARTGLSGTDAWLSRRTRMGRARAAREVKLAGDLDQGYAATGAALDAGDISTEHAQVIVAAAEQLPAGLDPAARARVESALVHRAKRLDPSQLRRVARRSLAAVADAETVDAHHDGLLRREEADAYERTRLTLHDNEDGTVSGHFVVPALAGSVLRKVLQAMTSPRRGRLGATRAQAGVPTDGLDWAQRRGQAFVELLEHLPTDHLHSRTAVTVVATIDQDRLRADLGAAGLDTGHELSAGDLRRLACGAGILPAVLGGVSRVLDLGRSQRFFGEAQALAVGVRHQTCAADGCDRPFAWCELHHRTPWAAGGRSDLRDAVALCGFHHRRVHDRRYCHRFRPDGALTFHQRE